jgi:hypothetical protein
MDCIHNYNESIMSTLIFKFFNIKSKAVQIFEKIQ